MLGLIKDPNCLALRFYISQKMDGSHFKEKKNPHHLLGIQRVIGNLPQLCGHGWCSTDTASGPASGPAAQPGRTGSRSSRTHLKQRYGTILSIKLTIPIHLLHLRPSKILNLEIFYQFFCEIPNIDFLYF